jgi:surface adhesin CshA-like protein
MTLSSATRWTTMRFASRSRWCRRLACVVLVCAAASAVLASSASAIPATGGAGRFGGAIDWVTWGSNNQALSLAAPITKQSVTNFAGHQLVVSCTISNFARVGGGAPAMSAYRSGNWGGDALDELYNIGGTNGANTLSTGSRSAGWRSASTSRARRRWTAAHMR